MYLRYFRFLGILGRVNLTEIKGLTGTQSFQWFPHSFNGEQTQEIFLHLGTQKGANLSLKRTKIRLAAGLRPDPLGELKCSPRYPNCNQGGPPLKAKEGREGE